MYICDKFILLLGFYRVNYDNTNWKLLQNQLESNPNMIPTLNRAQILNDALALASLGVVDYHIALNLTKYLGNQKESSAVPWIAAIESLQDIKLILRNTEYYGLFQVSLQFAMPYNYYSMRSIFIWTALFLGLHH